jgi:pimeloyl-ACP methyl ester carboxylesterase
MNKFFVLSCFIAFTCIGLIVSNGCNMFTSTGSYTSNAHLENEEVAGVIEMKQCSYQGVFRNPIIIVHGFLGANLINSKSHQNVWGEFTGMDGFSVSDEKMRNLAVPMLKGVPLSGLIDNTIPNGMLDTVTVSILGVSIKQNAYKNLIDILKKGGYQPEGQALLPGRNFNTLFQFAYDWRRDLVWNAKKLNAFIEKKRAYIREQYKVMYGIPDYNVHFDVIGHSMGGLLARYYLRYGTADLPKEGEVAPISWEGKKYIERLIILGTPNAGYLDTMIEMINGRDIPPFPPALLGTWVTYYEMLPVASRKSVVLKGSNTPVDLFNIENWKKYNWGLADPAQIQYLKILLPDAKDDNERREIALDHLSKCLNRAKRFVETMAVKANPPEGVKLYLVLGNAVKTSRRAELDPVTGKLTVIEYAPGDGKVTVSSALFDRRAGGQWTPFFSSPIQWNSIIQLRAAHMGITTAAPFKDNILFLLNAVPTARQKSAMDKLEIKY